jgi:hypothetical protein
VYIHDLDDSDELLVDKNGCSNNRNTVRDTHKWKANESVFQFIMYLPAQNIWWKEWYELKYGYMDSKGQCSRGQANKSILSI